MVTGLTRKLQQTTPSTTLGDLGLTLWEAGKPFLNPKEHSVIPFQFTDGPGHCPPPTTGVPTRFPFPVHWPSALSLMKVVHV